eukprot:tig00000093_g3594.t1
MVRHRVKDSEGAAELLPARVERSDCGSAKEAGSEHTAARPDGRGDSAFDEMRPALLDGKLCASDGGDSDAEGRHVDPAVEKELVARCTRKLLPLLCVCYIASFLDRANLGNAHASLMESLGITEHEYGLAASVFFITYVLFEVPCNAILERVSARVHIFVIMLLWGTVSALSACATGSTSLVLLRLALGAAEAGFFPGVVYYLTFFFPPAERAERLALLYTAVPVAGVLGALFAYAFLQMDGLLGLHGWQWLFLIEGLPTVLLGLVVLLYLPDGPWSAPWLTREEARIISSRPGVVTPPWRAGLRGGKVDPSGAPRAHTPHSTAEALRSSFSRPTVWLFGALYACDCFPLYALSLYLPAIVGEFGVHALLANLLSGLPYLAAALAMLATARHSDRSGERLRPILWANALGALGAAALAATYAGGGKGGPALLVLQLALASLFAGGVLASMPVTMGWAASDAGGSPAISLALVIVCGNLGGALAPVAMSEVRARSGGYAGGLLLLAASKAVAAALALLLHRSLRPAAARAAAAGLQLELAAGGDREVGAPCVTV